MRCVSYVRTSTLDQASPEKVSIPDQIKWAKDYAKEKEWEYVGEYIEPGIKGYSELEDREGVTNLFKDASEGKFDIVLVYHSSRVARESDLILKFCRILADYKVQVYCRNIPIDIVKKEEYYWGGNYIQQIMTSLAGVQDQQENVARSERVRNGFRGLAEKGRLVFAPYGYKKVYSVDINGKRTWTWEAEPRKALVVEDMFDCYGNKGMTIRGIMTYLNDKKKIPSPAGSTWNTATIKNTLSNPSYLGLVRWGRKLGSRYKQGRSKTGKQKRIITQSDKWILTPGDQPKIIDKLLFDKVQARLKQRGILHGRVIASPGLLTGLVKCGICGKNGYHKAQRIKSKGKNGKETIGFNYICQTYVYKGKNACRRHIMSAQKLHDLVLKDINEVVSSAAKRNKIFYTGSSSKLVQISDKQSLYQKEITNLENESRRLLEAYTKGFVKLDDLGSERNRIDSETQTIQTKLNELNQLRDIGESQKMAKERFKNLAKDFKNAFNKGSFSSQKELVHSLLESIIVAKNGNIQINYRLD